MSRLHYVGMAGKDVADQTDILGTQFDVASGGVFLHLLAVAGATEYMGKPRLMQRPGNDQLSRRKPVTLGNRLHLVKHFCDAAAVLDRETRRGGAVVSGIQSPVGAKCTR